ncbi:hypothetical protein CR513_59932, partial [Mucuna pruriens]
MPIIQYLILCGMSLGSVVGNCLSSYITSTPNQARADDLCLNRVNRQAILVPFPQLEHIQTTTTTLSDNNRYLLIMEIAVTPFFFVWGFIQTGIALEKKKMNLLAMEEEWHFFGFYDYIFRDQIFFLSQMRDLGLFEIKKIYYKLSLRLHPVKTPVMRTPKLILGLKQTRGDLTEKNDLIDLYEECKGNI